MAIIVAVVIGVFVFRDTVIPPLKDAGNDVIWYINDKVDNTGASNRKDKEEDGGGGWTTGHIVVAVIVGATAVLLIIALKDTVVGTFGLSEEQQMRRPLADAISALSLEIVSQPEAASKENVKKLETLKTVQRILLTNEKLGKTESARAFYTQLRNTLETGADVVRFEWAKKILKDGRDIRKVKQALAKAIRDSPNTSDPDKQKWLNEIGKR